MSTEVGFVIPQKSPFFRISVELHWIPYAKFREILRNTAEFRKFRKKYRTGTTLYRIWTMDMEVRMGIGMGMGMGTDINMDLDIDIDVHLDMNMDMDQVPSTN